MLEPPAEFPLIKPAPNPGFETNERLERIEEQFEQIQDIATEAAQIANGLQGAAAEFLLKFELAARDNDRTARRAILLAVLAVLAVVAGIVMPFLQIGYSEFRRTPDDLPNVESALKVVEGEVDGLRDAQVEMSAQLGEIINSSNAETATTLREIRDLLSKSSAPVGTVLKFGPR